MAEQPSHQKKHTQQYELAKSPIGVCVLLIADRVSADDSVSSLQSARYNSTISVLC